MDALSAIRTLYSRYLAGGVTYDRFVRFVIGLAATDDRIYESLRPLALSGKLASMFPPNEGGNLGDVTGYRQTLRSHNLTVKEINDDVKKGIRNEKDASRTIDGLLTSLENYYNSLSWYEKLQLDLAEKYDAAVELAKDGLKAAASAAKAGAKFAAKQVDKATDTGAYVVKTTADTVRTGVTDITGGAGKLLTNTGEGIKSLGGTFGMILPIALLVGGYIFYKSRGG